MYKTTNTLVLKQQYFIRGKFQVLKSWIRVRLHTLFFPHTSSLASRAESNWAKIWSRGLRATFDSTFRRPLLFKVNKTKKEILTIKDKSKSHKSNLQFDRNSVTEGNQREHEKRFITFIGHTGAKKTTLKSVKKIFLTRTGMTKRLL